MKIKENKNLKRQQKALATEQEQLQGSLEQKTLQCDATADELQQKKQELSQMQSNVQNVQHVNQTLNAQIERLQRNLSDNQDRNPVILEQLEVRELCNVIYLLMFPMVLFSPRPVPIQATFMNKSVLNSPVLLNVECLGLC